jgi:hypothetical protein
MLSGFLVAFVSFLDPCEECFFVDEDSSSDSFENSVEAVECAVKDVIPKSRCGWPSVELRPFCQRNHFLHHEPPIGLFCNEWPYVGI